MWDRENQRAARRAYKQARRDARYQYKTSRHMYRQGWRGYGYRRLVVPFIILMIFFEITFFLLFNRVGMMDRFFGVVPMIAIVAFVVVGTFAFRAFMAPPTPPQADQPSEAYSEYNQGYQSGSEQGNENEPLYRPKEPHSQDEQPQAYYPQQMPPMEQS